MLSIVSGLRALLSFQEKIQLVMLACLVCFAAIIETLGVASILPYMSLLTMPDSDLSQRVFGYASRVTGWTARDQLTVCVGCAVLVSVVFGALLSGLSTWHVLRFSMLRVHTMSQRILASYLGRDYEFFIQRNSSTLIKNLLSEVGNVVGGVMTPFIQMSTRIIVAFLLTILLFFVNFKVAAVSAGVFLGFYITIYAFTRRTLSRMGGEAVTANDVRYQTLSELFSGIREVKLWNKEAYYFSLFSQASMRFADMNSRSQLISLVPRYVLEILAFGGMVIVTIVLASVGENVSNYIPLLSLYAVAGYKLLPSMQQIFMNLSAIRFSAASLDTLIEESKTWLLVDAIPRSGAEKGFDRHLNREIRFEEVTYCYPGSKEVAVGPLNLSIPAFFTTGIIGSSGAGKSTLLDLMLGLLQPSSGRIFVDDHVLDADSCRDWAAKKVGYVPQSIYLTDCTVAENIAFGLPSGDIDLVAVEAAARAAQVYDVIDALPEKFNTRLGERGLRLSGGQCQRIAIARALYRNPEILIFDEATSALDSETEEAVMEAVRSLSHQKTIVIVTHRHSTLRDCERIYMLEGGKLVNAGAVPCPAAGSSNQALVLNCDNS